MRQAPALGQNGLDGIPSTARRLEGSEPQEILDWAVERYGDGLTLSVSFGGKEGMVLLDMLSKITGKVWVFTLDTGFLFEETIEFRKKVMEKYPAMNFKVIEPEMSVEEQARKHGPELWSCAPDLCCQIRKIEPQKKWLANYEAWATGIRRDQTHNRSDTPVVEWDAFFEVAKISPLAAWSKERVDEYVEENDVPLNPLLSRGYRSIGCEPCTRPVSEDEDERDGRWFGTEKTECGLHVVNGKVGRAVSQVHE
ncbi:MAG: phosphoadenylyl-sulfate reductase [Rubrobacteraceae bacterium]